MAGGEAEPSRPRKLKIPTSSIFTGEGEDLKPNRLNRWYREVKLYLKTFDINDDHDEVVEYYEAYTEKQAKDAYMTLLDEQEPDQPTLVEFKARFKQLFQTSTNTDDLYQQWQWISQTVNGRTIKISQIAADLDMLRSHLPKGHIIDFAQKQRFLAAMDIRLRRRVEPHIEEGDTWMEIVGLAE